MNNLEKRETLRWLRKMHEKFGQDIAVERKNGARLRFGDIIDDIIETVKGIPAAEDCHECKDCKYFEIEKDYDGIQFRTVDDLGRICIPRNIRDKLGIEPGTECAVYATDELTHEEIIVIRRNENEETP